MKGCMRDIQKIQKSFTVSLPSFVEDAIVLVRLEILKNLLNDVLEKKPLISRQKKDVCVFIFYIKAFEGGKYLIKCSSSFSLSLL